AMKGRPIPLMRDGALDHSAMRRTGVSVGDIEEAGRNSGIPSLGKVQEAVYERSGKISALRSTGKPKET
ncbi:MAG TPA: YetF domain-containing protein, partial [Pseudolabrys sp.]|nr:YetF domain-containing protein [Pseudolabrys sp.]